ncbi:hypothetical protein PENSPDRAFT_661467 [Peniophora sp. CONT]|nr:hypothetical protein PENSPDRAFT_661467 [Peniophora sp. CONT]
MSDVPLAADDDNYWSTILYEGLAYVRQTHAASQPEEPPVGTIQWPEDVLGYRFMSPPKPVRGRVLVNHDAHLFGVVNRSHRIAPYLLELLSPLYGLLLDGTPFDYTEGNIWRCPQEGCVYHEDVQRLSAQAMRSVLDVQPTPVPAGKSLLCSQDPARPTPRFLSLVVNIVGLRHYQDGHLGAVGLTCTIYGQDSQGNWLYEDQQSVLTSLTPEGSAARMHEDRERVRLQQRISLLSRRWAVTTQSAILRARQVDFDTFRRAMAENAREEHAKSLVNPRDVWKEACAVHALLYEGVHERQGRDVQQEAEMRNFNVADKNFDLEKAARDGQRQNTNLMARHVTEVDGRDYGYQRPGRALLTPASTCTYRRNNATTQREPLHTLDDVAALRQKTRIVYAAPASLACLSVSAGYIVGDMGAGLRCVRSYRIYDGARMNSTLDSNVQR